MMGFNNVGVGYRDAAVWSGRLKMALVEGNSFLSLIGVWGRGGKAPPECGERMGFNNIGVGYRDASV